MEDSRHKFLGFASPNIKYVSLFDILNNMGPRNFKQLKALLIMNSGRLDDNPMAVWFVMYRGTDIIVPKGGEADMSNKMVYNYITFIYDALTGRAMTTTTTPSVELDKFK